MNVFEDLVVELKEENLLENTVIEAEKQGNADIEIPEIAGEDVDSIEVVETGIHDTDPGEAKGFEIETETDVPAKKKNSRTEYFKKRAVDELAALQMVEHILTGVERAYMKVVPKTFDDFNAKKTLHIFLNLPEAATPEEQKAAETALRKETESWGTALVERDRIIAVSHIRQFCENSRPALSSQAIVAMARFYRNAPYSELVRAKFDFVMTRLFSKAVEHGKRAALFDRDDMLSHINTLYGEWSSVPLYTAESDESNVLLTGLSFEEMAAEAESATHFDQLIERDFFGRLRLFKDSINELFYAPVVIASAIESNVRIGNAYVDLLVRERQKMDSAGIQLKYIEFNEQSVSDATGRSLDLKEVLNELTDDVIAAHKASLVTAEAEPEPEKYSFDFSTPAPQAENENPSTLKTRLLNSAKNMNRGVVGFCLAMVFLSAGLYVWSTYLVDDQVSTANVKRVELEGTPFIEFVKTGRISGDTFYGLLQPSWDTLPKEKREEFLKKLLEAGSEKGYKQVSLTNKQGKAAGFASATRLEVNMP